MLLRSLSCGALVSAALLLSAPAMAQTPHTLVIGGDDGYGTSACLAEGSACGKVVADALCESHGYSAAHDFHKAAADEITASISPLTPSQQAFVINCGE